MRRSSSSPTTSPLTAQRREDNPTASRFGLGAADGGAGARGVVWEDSRRLRPTGAHHQQLAPRAPPAKRHSGSAGGLVTPAFVQQHQRHRADAAPSTAGGGGTAGGIGSGVRRRHSSAHPSTSASATVDAAAAANADALVVDDLVAALERRGDDLRSVQKLLEEAHEREAALQSQAHAIGGGEAPESAVPAANGAPESSVPSPNVEGLLEVLDEEADRVVRAPEGRAAVAGITAHLRSRLKAVAHHECGADWSRLFKEQDADGSGQLSWTDFVAMCRRLLGVGVRDNHLRILFRTLDLDKSGQISIVELVAFVDDPVVRLRSRINRALRIQAGNDWKKLFLKIDKDHSGEMDWAEFCNMCRSKFRLLEDDVQLASIFRTLDADGSGSVSLEELAAFAEDPAATVDTVPLKVVIVGAHGLVNAQCMQTNATGGRIDPYVTCEIMGRPKLRVKTKVLANKSDPEWNFVADIPDYALGESLVFSVWHRNWMARDFLIGRAKLKSIKFCGAGGFDGELSLFETGRGIKSYLQVKVHKVSATNCLRRGTTALEGWLSESSDDDRHGDDDDEDDESFRVVAAAHDLALPRGGRRTAAGRATALAAEGGNAGRGPREEEDGGEDEDEEDEGAEMDAEVERTRRSLQHIVAAKGATRRSHQGDAERIARAEMENVNLRQDLERLRAAFAARDEGQAATKLEALQLQAEVERMHKELTAAVEARDAAEHGLEAAHAEAERIVAVAREEADNCVKLARQTVAKERQEADKSVAAAKAEAENCVILARQAAEAERKNAQDGAREACREAADLIEEARQEAIRAREEAEQVQCEAQRSVVAAQEESSAMRQSAAQELKKVMDRAERAEHVAQQLRQQVEALEAALEEQAESSKAEIARIYKLLEVKAHSHAVADMCSGVSHDLCHVEQTRLVQEAQRHMLEASDKRLQVVELSAELAGMRREMFEGAETWKRFTPSALNSQRCFARTWAGGLGGQCGKRRLATSEFCDVHQDEASRAELGRVDGPIPERKMRQFLRQSTLISLKRATFANSTSSLAADAPVAGTPETATPASGPAASAAASADAFGDDRVRGESLSSF